MWTHRTESNINFQVIIEDCFDTIKTILIGPFKKHEHLSHYKGRPSKYNNVHLDRIISDLHEDAHQLLFQHTPDVLFSFAELLTSQPKFEILNMNNRCHHAHSTVLYIKFHQEFYQKNIIKKIATSEYDHSSGCHLFCISSR